MPRASRHLAAATIAAAVALAVAIAIAGCGSLVANPGGSGNVAGPVALGVGQAAPKLTGTTLDGGSVDLAALRGRPVIVNFWASYCIPCRSEFAEFKTALARHAADGLVVIGVVFKDDDTSARNFATGAGATWQSVRDPSGGLAKAFRVVAAPQTYFVDRSGIVRQRQIGPIVSDAEMEQFVAGILT